jgi:hypothetical protein
MECRKIDLSATRIILMASTDYTSTRNSAEGIRRSMRGRGLGVVLFVTAFAFHVAVLFNLLPS